MASAEMDASQGTKPKSVAKILTSPQFITWTALAFMTVSSVASLRPAPTMAVYGLSSVFLYIVPAIVFLFPTALVAAELASGWNGGVYRWVTRRHLAPVGLPGDLVPVRDDDLLLPEPSGVCGQHLCLRD